MCQAQCQAGDTVVNKADNSPASRTAASLGGRQTKTRQLGQLCCNSVVAGAMENLKLERGAGDVRGLLRF